MSGNSAAMLLEWRCMRLNKLMFHLNAKMVCIKTCLGSRSAGVYCIASAEYQSNLKLTVTNQMSLF